MSDSRRKIGDWGEERAVEYLIKKGYSIKNKNVRNSYGEIDIVARINNKTIFVEVKTRRNTSFGNPEDSVNIRKKIKLIESAVAYMQEHPELGNDWQIDVIAIQTLNKDEFQVIHFENAVDDYE